MLSRVYYIFLFTHIIFSVNCFAQDTIIVNNNYKYKIGAKFIAERSSPDIYSDDSYPVYSGGLQIIRKIAHTRFGVETGLYFYNKATRNYFYQTLGGQSNYFSLVYYYHNLSLPVSFRYDTKLLYFSVGGYADYLLNTSGQEFLDSDSVIVVNMDDRKWNFGVNINVGMEKNINTLFNFFVEARYLFNFTSSPLEDGDLYGSAIKNYGFAVGLNYNLSPKKKYENK